MAKGIIVGDMTANMHNGKILTRWTSRRFRYRPSRAFFLGPSHTYTLADKFSVVATYFVCMFGFAIEATVFANAPNPKNPKISPPAFVIALVFLS